MARSRETIQATMDVEQATHTELATLNSTSTTSIFTLWKFITSSIINYFEQLWDLYKIEIETVIKNAPVGSNFWVQKRIFDFQYSATVPQVLQVDANTLAVNYPIVDPTLLLITRCSVKTTPVKTVTIKVAKSEPPVALSAPELASLVGYVSDISFAGVNYSVTSLASDKLYLKADIYYNGQYASTISANVISAIKTYLSNLPFDGAVNLLKLTDAIQAVVGVTDIVLQDVAMRADATAFVSKTYLVLSKTTVISTYPSQAGYVEEETTVGSLFTNTLNFIAQ
jgi:hypothetical protein